jgi:hypothetical protein
MEGPWSPAEWPISVSASSSKAGWQAGFPDSPRAARCETRDRCPVILFEVIFHG